MIFTNIFSNLFNSRAVWEGRTLEIVSFSRLQSSQTLEPSRRQTSTIFLHANWLNSLPLHLSMSLLKYTYVKIGASFSIFKEKMRFLMQSSTMQIEGGYFRTSSRFLFSNLLRCLFLPEESMPWISEAPQVTLRLSSNPVSSKISDSINDGRDLASVALSMLSFMIDSISSFLVSNTDQNIDQFPSSTISRILGSLGKEGNIGTVSTASMGCDSISSAMKWVDSSNVLLYFICICSQITSYLMKEQNSLARQLASSSMSMLVMLEVSFPDSRDKYISFILPTSKSIWFKLSVGPFLVNLQTRNFEQQLAYILPLIDLWSITLSSVARDFLFVLPLRLCCLYSLLVCLDNTKGLQGESLWTLSFYFYFIGLLLFGIGGMYGDRGTFLVCNWFILITMSARYQNKVAILYLFLPFTPILSSNLSFWSPFNPWNLLKSYPQSKSIRASAYSSSPKVNRIEQRGLANIDNSVTFACFSLILLELEFDRAPCELLTVAEKVDFAFFTLL